MKFIRRLLRKFFNVIWKLHAKIYVWAMGILGRKSLNRESDAAAPEGKVIYLTFDDGPGRCTQKLLTILARYNVKATFFVTGNGDDNIISMIAKEGHVVGNHTKSHNYKAIYASEEAFYKALNEMDAVIARETGVHTRLMRFPGGSSNTVSRFNPGVMSRLAESVQKDGYHYFDWNVDSDDAGKAYTSYEIFRNIISGIERVDRAVVLQHDVKPQSVAVVERIILWGLKHGYTFLPLDENSISCRHEIAN